MVRRLGLNYFNCHDWTELQNIESENSLILVTNTHTDLEKIPKSILKKTQLMLHPNSGHDNFPLSFVKEMPFPIVLGNEIRAQAVIEYTLGHLWSHFAYTPHQESWNKTRVWPRELLANKKVLIVGQGPVGKGLANALKFSAAHVYTYDPYKKEAKLGAKVTKENNLLEALEKSDILILASSLNEKNHHLISENELKALGPEGLVINPARGSLIKEADLKQYLLHNPNTFAILDVFENEPRVAGHFLDIPNCHLTSHIAGVSKDLEKNIIAFEEKALSHWLKGNTEDILKFYHDQILGYRIVENMMI